MKIGDGAKSWLNLEPISGDISGLTGIMHFVGVKESLPDSVLSYDKGDVILVDNKEYVNDGKKWIELGDESSYALKTLKVNGHQLTGDFNLTASEVGAAISTDITSEIDKLAAIAKTGSTDDLTQGTNIIVLNCGGAAE